MRKLLTLETFPFSSSRSQHCLTVSFVWPKSFISFMSKHHFNQPQAEPSIRAPLALLTWASKTWNVSVGNMIKLIMFGGLRIAEAANCLCVKAQLFFCDLSPSQSHIGACRVLGQYRRQSGVWRPTCLLITCFRSSQCRAHIKWWTWLGCDLRLTSRLPW